MEKIFFNGKILTMEEQLYVPAVLICDGIISEIDTYDRLKVLSPNAEKIDLHGSAMLPAFIDAHGHFSSYANAQIQVPLDETASFDEISRRISDFIAKNDVKPGQWVVAKGYDHNTLSEKSHPNLALLNSIAPANPMILQHQSGHCGVLNSMALSALNITAQTPSPPGGVIGKSDGALTGYMEEDAYISCIKQVPMSDLDTMLSAYSKAQERYLSYGIATVQEGMMVAQMLPLYKALIASGLLKLDVVGYSEMPSMEAISSAFPRSVRQYDKHFKIGGYKIFLDGSPQVKTAWMKTPYAGSDANFGYGTMSDSQVLLAVKKSAAEGFQILAHCNGDAAAQQYIDAISAIAAQNKKITSLKPVIIHAQLLSPQQLPAVAALNIIPSFFIAHVLHWGDIHMSNFGYDRAQYISPARAALDNDITFTFHQDAPVIEPDMLETVQCAVTRTTKSGVVLGENQCISTLEALKAVTINAAYQYSEEGSKGSIKIGKHADFVIMSDDPLQVPKNEISKIEILKTIKDGRVIYQKN